nr:hypothetical protein Csa_1G097685 [Ipomoea batatas]GMD29481.1 hypothetical protein Csa_1G097685 [Ipomoea batatas]
MILLLNIVLIQYWQETKVARENPIMKRTATLDRILPETEATPAFPMSDLTRLRLSRMIGTSGAAANVDTKQVKKEIHERWKVLMWGLAKEKSLNTLALCSESTGRANFAVVSVGTIGEATAKARTGSLPVTPCMELPGDPSTSAINVFVSWN